jgi:uncharacterized protein with PQ loop repeat
MGIINFFLNLGILIGPSIGYICQSYKFKKNKSSKGFCLSMCLKILLSSIFKIYFWFGKRYNIFLLYQALLVLFLQYVIIYNYLKFKDDSDNLIKPMINENNNKFLHKFYYCVSDYFSIKNFWKWNHLFSYIFYSCILTIIIGCICYIFGFKNEVFLEIIGYISTAIDVLLGFPQIYTNYKLKNCNSLSTVMIGAFLIGDTFRTYYYILTKSPFQFILCGILQISINIIIMLQIIYYRRIISSDLVLLIAEKKVTNNEIENKPQGFDSIENSNYSIQKDLGLSDNENNKNSDINSQDIKII